MELLQRAVGPLATNVYLLGDVATGAALAIDAATPSAEWIREQLRLRDWRLELLISTHRHWDHIGDNAAVVAATGARLGVHVLDRPGLERPEPLYAPFPIPPSVPALELAERDVIALGSIRLEVLHTPGHTEGSVCLLVRDGLALFSGDTLFAGGWGRVDLPGGSAEAMVESLSRLAGLDDPVRVLPGHGTSTTIGRERPWLEQVARERRLLL